MVNESSILERLVTCLNQQGFKRLVVVTGYQEKCIRDFLGTKFGNMKIEYVFSPKYKITNNIYSLWMARNIINEPFMLVESDLVFDESLLDDMRYPDRIAVARMQPWMNGTTVSLNKSQKVKNFNNGAPASPDEIRHKTVNIYSFSLFSWRDIIKKLNHYISEGKVNCYYETILAEMVTDGSLSLQAVSFDEKLWYEIDTVEDMRKAEKLFSEDVYETITPSNSKTKSLSTLRLFPRQIKGKNLGIAIS
jgi:choline kinase